MIFRYLPAMIADFLSHLSHSGGKSVELYASSFDEKLNGTEVSTIQNKNDEKIDFDDLCSSVYFEKENSPLLYIK